MAHSSNLFLASLSYSDMDLLRPHLRSEQLAKKKELLVEGGQVSRVYFPTNAVISLIASVDGGKGVESAMLGRDDVIGASPALDDRTSLVNAVVQIPGQCLVCEVNDLKAVALESTSLLSSIMHHAQVLYAQAHLMTSCVSFHNVEQRLCRLLLRAHDLRGEVVIPITQFELSALLGVRRTSVTQAALNLMKAELIDYNRGFIVLINADGLKRRACGCYGAVKLHYATLRSADQGGNRATPPIGGASAAAASMKLGRLEPK